MEIVREKLSLPCFPAPLLNQAHDWLLLFCGALLLSNLCGHSAQAQSAHFSGMVATLGSGFSLSKGVAVDEIGNVYFGEFLQHNLIGVSLAD